MTIGLLHPGSMGAAVAACLVDAGKDVAWASAGRGPATGERARASGLRDLTTVARLAEECELIISLCPPEAALGVALEVAGYAGVYLDANAISPATVAEIRAALPNATYVDGSVIGQTPRDPGTTRLYVSGPAAQSTAAALSNPSFELRVLGDEPTAASALKMVYAAWTKGTQALLIAIRAAAQELGVEPDLIAEWSLSLPELTARSDNAQLVAAERGWRWAYEMEEIARTFRIAHQPTGFGLAAAEVFARHPRP